MDRAGMIAVTGHLKALAELYRVRPPGDTEVRIWFDRLKALPTEDICDILIAWPDSNRFYPTIDQVLNTARIRAAGFHRARYQQQLPDAQAVQAASETGRRELAKIRAILARPRPGPDAPPPWRRLSDSIETEAQREARLEREAIRAEGGA